MSKAALLLAVLILMLAGCGGSTGSTTITVHPSLASVLPGGSRQFSVAQNVEVDWTAPDGGSVVNGLFTAPSTPGTYRVVATNIINPLSAGTAFVTVANVQVTVTPSFASVAKSSVNTNLFTAIVAGTPDRTVTWTVIPASAGSIAPSTPDGSGNARATFTAGTTAGTFQVRATSVAEPTVSENALVTVMGSSSIALNPTSASLTATPPNNTVTLTAVLTNSNGAVDTTTPIIWEITNNPVGATLTGADLRQRVFTVPTSFLGDANCTVRVRTSQGISATSFIQVHAGP